MALKINLKHTWLRGLSGDFFHSFHIMSLYWVCVRPGFSSFSIGSSASSKAYKHYKNLSNYQYRQKKNLRVHNVIRSKKKIDLSLSASKAHPIHGWIYHTLYRSSLYKKKKEKKKKRYFEMIIQLYFSSQCAYVKLWAMTMETVHVRLNNI